MTMRWATVCRAWVELARCSFRVTVAKGVIYDTVTTVCGSSRMELLSSFQVPRQSSTGHRLDVAPQGGSESGGRICTALLRPNASAEMTGVQDSAVSTSDKRAWLT